MNRRTVLFGLLLGQLLSQFLFPPNALFTRWITGHRVVISQPYPAVWAFDCDFPQQHVAQVREAFNWWNTNGTIPVMFTEAPVCGIMDLASLKTDPGRMRIIVQYKNQLIDRPGLTPYQRLTILGTGETGHTRLGYAINSGILTLYKPWETDLDSEAQQENVLRHEIGHMLGMGHSDQPGDDDCLMFPTVSEDLFNRGTLCPKEITALKEAYGHP